jgi:nitroreductase
VLLPEVWNPYARVPATRYRFTDGPVRPPTVAPVSTENGLHPLLAGRRSPWSFDPRAEVTDRQLAAVLEAARWAPSSGNTQPWRFLVGRRGDDTFATIFGVLRPRNRTWAGRAGVLMLGVYDLGGDRPLRHARYDLGQAVAHLSVQAAHEGLVVHQMAGFDPEAARTAFGIPAGYEPFVAVALGHRGDTDGLPDDLVARQERPRRRRPLAETAFGTWDVPLGL